jgi:CheY-like chemotaxis protein
MKVGLMADKERILVVDDEPSIRKYLGTLLEVDGYQVETATVRTSSSWTFLCRK